MKTALAAPDPGEPPRTPVAWTVTTSSTPGTYLATTAPQVTTTATPGLIWAAHTRRS